MPVLPVILFLISLAGAVASQARRANQLESHHAKACEHQIRMGWIPLDCLWAKVESRRSWAERSCVQHTRNVAHVMDLPKNWRARVPRGKCYESLAQRELELRYSEGNPP